jgi:hypothetical protein
LQYGLTSSTLSSFSREQRITIFSLAASSSRLRINELPDLPRNSPYALKPESNNRHGYLSPPLLRSNVRYRIINLLPIDYASRPRLRIRLTLGGLTFPRKPWAFGEHVSHMFVATHASICSCSSSSIRRRTPSMVATMLPYHSNLRWVHSFGATLEPRYIFRARTLDQ